MFDEFHFLDDMAKLTSCAAGHPVKYSQTKSLACVMRHYYVYAGRVYSGSAIRGGEDNTQRLSFIDAATGRLMVRDTTTYDLVTDLTGTIELHYHCNECDPVFYESNDSWDGMGMSGMEPRCSWLATFDKGVLMNVESHCETRDDIRKKLIEMARPPLPDDDRVVKRELELRRDRRKNPLF